MDDQKEKSEIFEKENCVKKDAAKDASQAAVGSSSQAISHCDAVEQSSSAIETIADPAQPDDLVDYETYRVLKKTRKLMKKANKVNDQLLWNQELSLDDLLRNKNAFTVAGKVQQKYLKLAEKYQERQQQPSGFRQYPPMESKEIRSGNDRLDNEIVNMVHRFREQASKLEKRLPDISNIEDLITKGGYQREMRLTDDEVKGLARTILEKVVKRAKRDRANEYYRYSLEKYCTTSSHEKEEKDSAGCSKDAQENFAESAGENLISNDPALEDPSLAAKLESNKESWDRLKEYTRAFSSQIVQHTDEPDESEPEDQYTLVDDEAESESTASDSVAEQPLIADAESDSEGEEKAGGARVDTGDKKFHIENDKPELIDLADNDESDDDSLGNQSDAASTSSSRSSRNGPSATVGNKNANSTKEPALKRTKIDQGLSTPNTDDDDVIVLD